MLVESCWNPLRCAASVLFAEAINRPRTRADIVAVRPVPILMTSFESLLRCGSGRAPRRNTPAKAPPKVQANTTPAMTRELTVGLPDDYRNSTPDTMTVADSPAPTLGGGTEEHH